MKATTRAQKWSLPNSFQAANSLFGIAALLALIPLSIGLFASLSGLAGRNDGKFDVIDFAEHRIVSVQEARALIASGALVIDARDVALRDAQPLANAQPLALRDLTGDADAVTAKLQTLGLSAAQPVVVVGDPLSGRGDEGSVVLTLRGLGHPRAVLVDGGMPALRAAGLPTIYPPFGKGDFEVHPNRDWALDAETLTRDLHRGDIAVIDLGMGEILPGAKRLSLADFRDEAGAALSASAVADLFAEHGIDPAARLIAYGSEADGAGWLAALLLDLGYDVAGYAIATTAQPLVN